VSHLADGCFSNLIHPVFREWNKRTSQTLEESLIQLVGCAIRLYQTEQIFFLGMSTNGFHAFGKCRIEGIGNSNSDGAHGYTSMPQPVEGVNAAANPFLGIRARRIHTWKSVRAAEEVGRKIA